MGIWGFWEDGWMDHPCLGSEEEQESSHQQEEGWDGTGRREW